MRGFFQIPNFLSDYYSHRRQRNRRFSLRGMARQLGLDVGALSRYMSGERLPLPDTALRIAARLNLNQDQTRRFIELCRRDMRIKSRVSRRRILRKSKPHERPVVIHESQFDSICNWYSVAILDMTRLKSFRPDPKWIGDYLGIKPSLAKRSLTNLLLTGLLEKRGDTLQKRSPRLTTSNREFTTEKLRQSQEQFLRRALKSLRSIPVGKRVNTTTVMAIDPQLLPLARQLISQFNESLCHLLEAGSPSEVYASTVSLTPLKESRHENG